MAPKANLIKTTDSTVNPRVIDFITRFQDSFEGLLNILGITRMIKKEPGTTLRVVKAAVTLENTVAEGEEIPYSQGTLYEVPIGDVTFSKHAKAVSVEEITKNGYEIAVAKTDNAFMNELQNEVKDAMYDLLNDGTLTAVDSSFQMALAMAKGRVLERFSQLGLESTEVVAFVNYLDFYTHLGGASIGAQVETAFGINYIKGYLGYNTIFLCNSTEVARNTVIATPVENMVAYYVDPSASDFGNAGLEYVTAGLTPFIGLHVGGNYNTAVSELHSISAIYLFCEYLEAVAVESIVASGSIGSVSVASAAGTTKGTKLTFTIPSDAPEGYRVYVTSATSPSVATYLTEPDSSWTQVLPNDSGVVDNLELSGAKVVGAITNGAGQFLYTSSAVSVVNHA